MSSEMMSPMGFRLMLLMFWIRDRVAKPWKKLDHFGIRKGNVVVDYGAGTGAYLPHASELVGQQGKVYAVDINPTAVKACRKVAKKKPKKKPAKKKAGKVVKKKAKKKPAKKPKKKAKKKARKRR